MFRFRFVSILLLACALAGPALAENAHDHSGDHAHAHDPVSADAAAAPATPTPGGREAVIQVNGIVCSFCAHGVQKALGKLGILDATKYQKGVFVDADEQRVVLALADDVAIPFAEIGRRIRKAGYEPIRFELELRGAVRPAGDGEGDRHLIDVAGQTFVLSAAAAPPSPDAVVASAAIDAALAESLAADAPVPVTVDAWR